MTTFLLLIALAITWLLGWRAISAIALADPDYKCGRFCWLALLVMWPLAAFFVNADVVRSMRRR